MRLVTRENTRVFLNLRGGGSGLGPWGTQVPPFSPGSVGEGLIKGWEGKFQDLETHLLNQGKDQRTKFIERKQTQQKTSGLRKYIYGRVFTFWNTGEQNKKKKKKKKKITNPPHKKKKKKKSDSPTVTILAKQEKHDGSYYGKVTGEQEQYQRWSNTSDAESKKVFPEKLRKPCEKEIDGGKKK